MSFLKAALELAEKGFHVFPLVPNSKLPAIKDFPHQASKDPKKIKMWWTDPVLGTERDYNVGISTTEYNCTQSLVVIDVDNKGDKKGSDEIFQLELNGYNFDATFSQRTPTGGEHLVYKWKEPLTQGTNKLGMGLDIRSKGGYIVAAGSTIDGEPYTVQNDRSVTDCPEWIVEKLNVAPEKQQVVHDLSAISIDAAIPRAMHYLVSEAPIALEGEGGDETTYKVAARLKDMGIPQDLAVELMADNWNERCEPPWDIDQLETKVTNAYQYGTKAAGSDAPETQFETIKSSNDAKFYLSEMNKRFALIFENQGHAILEQTTDEKGRPLNKYFSENTFKRMFSPYTVLQDGGKRPINKAEVWLDWKFRREYNGVCFKPEREAENMYFNTWRGFQVKATSYETATPAARKGYEMFIEHTQRNICNGNRESYNWLMTYFAHLVQKPWEKPLTTVVFKGRKGVGKNAFVDRIGAILGSGHYLVAHDSRYLTSNFNGHFESCLLLVLDEAFWSGDKAAEGKLKGLTTSPSIMIERKGKEAYTIDNMLRFVIIGNEDWLVPASADERRYSVFEIGEARMRDNKFFEAMRIAMDEKGGNEILYHQLKNWDMKLSDVNNPLENEALRDQKIQSLSPFQQFWFESLNNGTMGIDLNGAWEQRVSKESLRNRLYKFLKDRNIKSWRPSDKQITVELKKLSPTTDARARTLTPERLSAYIFKELDRVRNDFQNFLGHEIEWD